MHKIVLFKNKKLKKVFSTYKEYNRCNTKFKELLKDNKSVEFYIDHANGNDVNYELAIICPKKETFIFQKDEYGRNFETVLDSDKFSICKIEPYYIEETIRLYDRNTTVTFNQIYDELSKIKDLFSLTVLNNKIVKQVESEFELFVLKNQNNAERFKDLICNKLISNGNACICVSDTSIVNRKMLYDKLTDMGYDKTFLYRKTVN